MKMVKEAMAVLKDNPKDPYRNFVRRRQIPVLRQRRLEQGITGCPGSRKRREVEASSNKRPVSPTSSDGRLKVGDAWWGLADEGEAAVKQPLKGRAGYWYAKALPELSGLLKDKVEKRLAQAGVSEPLAGPSATEEQAAPQGVPFRVVELSIAENGQCELTTDLPSRCRRQAGRKAQPVARTNLHLKGFECAEVSAER